MSKKKNKYRSKFEANFAKDLRKRKIKFKYETEKITYVKPILNGTCKDCGSGNVGKICTYTPDFILKDFIIETKGRFAAADRKKMLLIKEQYPEKDIRIVFLQNRYVTRNGVMRYSDWCDANGYKWAIGTAPEEWFNDEED